MVFISSFDSKAPKAARNIEEAYIITTAGTYLNTESFAFISRRVNAVAIKANVKRYTRGELIKSYPIFFL